MIVIENLSKCYKNFNLDKISFSVPKGYIMGLIGANGAGKSTIIKSIATLIKPDSGYIKINDLLLTSEDTLIREKVGYISDENIYPLTNSLIKNAKLIAPFYPKWSWTEFNRLCDIFKIDKKKPLSKLSKGNQSKTQIILALSHIPEFLIMDEPTTGLDSTMRLKFKDVIREYVDIYKTTVIFSTHITTDLEDFADYISYIKEGKLIFTDEYESVLDSYSVVSGSSIEKCEGIISLKKNRYSSTALVDNRAFDGSDDLIKESSTLESIMYFFESDEVKSV